MQWDTCPMNLCLGQAMESRAVGKEGFGNEWQDSARAGQLPRDGADPWVLLQHSLSSLLSLLHVLTFGFA